MSCKELIESLKKAADERISLLWKEAETEAAAVRSEVDRRVDQMREDHARKQAIMTRDRTVQSLSEANSRARAIRLASEKELSDRLYQIAVAALPSLRNKSYPETFAKLAHELPRRAWKTVRVNPGDLGLAKKHFPGAEIAGDAAIVGGMDVSAQDGAIRVINTFEKRLERIWVDLQPLLIREVYREVVDEASAAIGGPGLSGRVPSDEDQRQAVSADI